MIINFIADEDTVSLSSPHSEQQQNGVVISTKYIDNKEVGQIEDLVDLVLKASLQRISQEERMEILVKFRKFWDDISATISEDKVLKGGDIEVDEGMYTHNAAQAGRWATIMGLGLVKREDVQDDSMD